MKTSRLLIAVVALFASSPLLAAPDYFAPQSAPPDDTLVVPAKYFPSQSTKKPVNEVPYFLRDRTPVVTNAIVTPSKPAASHPRRSPAPTLKKLAVASESSSAAEKALDGGTHQAPDASAPAAVAANAGLKNTDELLTPAPRRRNLDCLMDNGDLDEECKITDSYGRVHHAAEPESGGWMKTAGTIATAAIGAVGLGALAATLGLGGGVVIAGAIIGAVLGFGLMKGAAKLFGS